MTKEEREYREEFAKFKAKFQSKVGSHVKLNDEEGDCCDLLLSTWVGFDIAPAYEAAIKNILGTFLSKQRKLFIVVHHNYETGSYDINSSSILGMSDGIGYQGQDFDKVWEDFICGAFMIGITLKI